MSVKDRRAMIVPGHKGLSRRRQCVLLGISRSSTYYRPKGVSDRDLQLMRAIDEQYTKTPFYGRRRMCVALRGKGFKVSEKRVRQLMGKMGLHAVAPRPNTSKPSREHKTYPYLLRNVTIHRPNHVWCADITYIPMEKGFMYLCAIMDWHSRKVLSWSLSSTLDAEFCVSCLERAIAVHGRPEIFNTDQGTQFTSKQFTDVLIEHNIAISMDGKGRCMDNIFIERLWRSLKYELLYIQEFASVPGLRRGLVKWFTFYNQERPHQSLGYQSPDEVYHKAAAA